MRPLPLPSGERWQRIDALLDGALERPPDQRAAFLDDACGGDRELRAEVDELLALGECDDGFLETPAIGRLGVAPDAPAATDPQRAPTVVTGAGATPLDEITGSLRGEVVYRELGELGRGGMGAVLEVHDPRLDRRLAMKTVLGRDGRVGAMSGTTPASVASLRRFLIEARITAQLDHPGVVPVHELGLDASGRLYFTMKRVDGQTLGEILDLARAGAADWTSTRIVQIFLRVCETLAYAHTKGIIHRDLKPANIMVGRYGEVYVMDWGVARILDRPGEPTVELAAGTGDELADRTRDGAILGTPSYMSPEQAAGRIDELDERADLYSIGAMLYRFLTGRSPYSGDDAAALLAAIHAGPPPPIAAITPTAPAELEAITMKAMARRPEDRYRSAADLAADLQAYLEGRVVRAHRVGALVEARKWIDRNRALATALALLVTGALAGSVAFGFQQRRATHRVAAERDVARAERLRADGLRLAEQASNVAAREPYVALLLGLEAARRSPGRQAREALLAAAADLTEVRVLFGHDDDVGQILVSPDGRSILTLGNEPDDGQMMLWSDDGELVHRLEAGPRVVRTARFLDDEGRAFVTVDAAGRTLVWDAATGRVATELQADGPAVTGVAVTDDRRWLVTIAADGARLWVRVDPSRDWTLERTVATLSAPVAVATQGTRVATATEAGVVQIWDPASGVELDRLRPAAARPQLEIEAGAHSRHVILADRYAQPRLTFDAAGRRLLAQTPTAGAALWEVATGRLLAASPGAPSSRLSPDGRYLALEYPLQLWDVDQGRRTGVFEGNAYWYAFDPASRHLIGTRGDSTYEVHMWRTSSGEQVRRFAGHRLDTYAGTFHPDGERILTGGDDATIRIWRIRPELLLAHDPRIVAVDPAAGRAVRIDEGRAHLIEIGGDEVVRELGGEGLPDGLRGRVSADGQWAEARPMPGDVTYLWSLRTGALRVLTSTRGGEFDLDRGLYYRLALAGTGRARPGVEVLDLATGEIVRQFGDTRFAFIDLQRDGARLLATEGGHGLVSVWDTRRGVRLRSLAGHESFTVDAAFSPDGELAVSSSMGQSLRIWDVDSATTVRVVRGVPRQELRVAFTPDATRVIAWPRDGGVRVFRVRDGTLLLRLPDRRYRVAEIEPSGAFLLTIDDVGAVRRWPLEPVAWASARARHRPDPDTWDDFAVDDNAELERYREQWLLDHPSAHRYAQHGYRLMSQGDVDEALEWMQRARELRPGKWFGDIGLARAFALRAGDRSGAAAAADRDAALRAIERAIDTSGFGGADWLDGRREMASLRDDPRYRELLTRIRRASPAVD